LPLWGCGYWSSCSFFSFIGPVFYTLDPSENIFEEDVANFYMYKINQAIKQDPGLKEYLGHHANGF